jgi:hypothetical protein
MRPLAVVELWITGRRGMTRAENPARRVREDIQGKGKGEGEGRLAPSTKW